MCGVSFDIYKVCKKQFVGQTTDKFRFKWLNDYKTCQKKKGLCNRVHTKRYFHPHFLQEDHSGLIIDCVVVNIYN